MITRDLDLQRSTFIQFYFKFGCINAPTKRDHNVLVDFSTNGGTQWTNMAELYYDQYSEARYSNSHCVVYHNFCNAHPLSDYCISIAPPRPAFNGF